MSKFFSAGVLLVLEDEKPAVIAVIGCGGKTTLIESLAHEYRHKKVLVTPTTKIFPMHGEGIVLRTNSSDCLSHVPVNGIQCLGELNQATGKLEALEQELLEEIVPRYELILFEADGSNGLPCKGWLPYEPVIPPFCTHTIGVVTLSALGKPADSDTVLRLPEFSKLTGMEQGETITRQALTDMVCAENGMFRNAIGRQCIFVNQAEDQGIAAEEWLRAIHDSNPGRFDYLTYGSARTNSWTLLHETGKVLPLKQMAS